MTSHYYFSVIIISLKEFYKKTKELVTQKYNLIKLILYNIGNHWYNII